METQIIADIRKDIRDIEKEIKRIDVKATEALGSSKSAHHRLSTIENQTNAILRLTGSIEYMGEQVKELISVVKEQDKRLDALEKQPGIVALKGWWIIAGAILSALGGFLISPILRHAVGG